MTNASEVAAMAYATDLPNDVEVAPDGIGQSSESDAMDVNFITEQATAMRSKFQLEAPPRLSIIGRRPGVAVLTHSILSKRRDESYRDPSKYSVHRHAGMVLQEIYSEDIRFRDVEEFDLAKNDVLIFVYSGDLSIEAADVADHLFEKHTITTYLVEMHAASDHSKSHGSDKSCPIHDNPDPYFFDLNFSEDNLCSCSTCACRNKAEIKKLMAAILKATQDENKRALLRAIFARNATDVAALREKMCQKQISALMATSAAAGAVPAPGIPTLAIMITVATMLFIDAFCLTSSSVDKKEHVELLGKLNMKLLPRVLAMTAPFVTADMGKDSLLLIPGVGIVLNFVVGGAICGFCLHQLCPDLISRLRVAATAFYEMDMDGAIDQESLDAFVTLIDNLFAVIPSVDVEDVLSSIDSPEQVRQTSLDSAEQVGRRLVRRVSAPAVIHQAR